ncbi:MAG: thioesterase family protein [Bacteroidales bacterium]|nr:thioesterase family protein [Bacteroidales bacterium]
MEEFAIPERIVHKKELTVTQKDTAIVYGSGLLPVFATPAMIAFMENVSHESVAPYLPSSLTTVGTEINIEHKKASAIGQKLTCQSVLTKVNNRQLCFHVEVSDGVDIVGRGTHTRFVVDKEKFMAKVTR